MLLLVLGACLLGLPPAGRSAEPGDTVRFVMADVVKLREAPSREAAVLANLRINSSVTVLENAAPEDGWSRVSLGHRVTMTGFELIGYVASAFLGAEPQTAEGLLAQYADRLREGDLDRAKAMAERLVALEPEKTEHLTRLRSVYERLGDTAGVGRVDGYLQGRGTKILGYCASLSGGPGRHAIVLAEYRPGHGLRPWVATIQGGSLAERVEAGLLTRLGLALQRGPWFELDPINSGRPVAIVAGPLGTAVVPPPARDITGYREGEKLVLNSGCGDSRESRLVFSNEPMSVMQVERIDPSTVADLIPAIPGAGQRGIQSVSAQRSLDGRPLTIVRGGSGGAYIWALFDGSAGRLLGSVGSYDRPHGADSVREVRWFTWPLSGHRVAIVEHHNTAFGGEGPRGDRIDVLVVDNENNVETLTLMSHWRIVD